MSQNRLNKVVEHLLKMNAISYNREELAFQIQSHPSYPSLHSITGVLDHFNIENLAAEVPVCGETLDQLPDTFIAQISTQQGSKLCAVTQKKTQCSVIFPNRKKEEITRGEFLERFTGVIVAVGKAENRSSVNIANNRFYQVIWIAVTALLMVIFFKSSPSLEAGISVSLALVGTIISMAILKQELGLQSTLGNTFCSSTSDQKDCDAVITSKGSKLFGDFKFSDLGFIYFASFSLLSLLFSMQGQGLNSLFLVSLLSLPVIAYSIYYQALIVKKWCMLCLALVTVLTLQIVTSLAFSETWSVPTMDDLLTLSFVFLTIFSIWTYLKPRYKQLQSGEETRIKYLRFKRDFSLFSTLLNQSDSLDTYIPGTEEIVLGNKESHLNITIITNPFCGHCKSVHTLVEDVLHKYHPFVGITIRFNVNISDAESDIVRITSRLIEIYKVEGEQVCLNAMSEIYGNVSPGDWLKKWSGESTDKHPYLRTLEQGKYWCHTHQINFTPEILINGKSFPRAYEKGDLIYFIEELHEQIASDEEARKTTEFQEINA